MNIQHNCPRCRLKIAEERLKVVPFVCDHCGFTLSKPSTTPRHLHDNADSQLFLVIASGILVLFLLLASSVELRWLQMRDIVGLSSYKSLNRMIAVCTDLKNHKCVEHALTKQAKWDPKRSVKLAEYLLTRNKAKAAVAGLQKYVASGNADSKALVLYGQALAETGRLDEATRYFERAIAGSKPSIDNMRIYVKYLTRSKRFDQALSVIIRARKVMPNALAVEYRVISEMRSAGGNRVVAGKR